MIAYTDFIGYRGFKKVENMPLQVSTGATLLCTFGMAPGAFIATGSATTFAGGPPAGTIMDNKPFANISGFAMCNSLANPTVSAATAAAMGVLTPMPCIPATVAPWAPGATKTMIGKIPALHNGCSLMCTWGGKISVVVPGQMKLMVT